MKKSNLLTFTLAIIFILLTMLACFPGINASASTMNLTDGDYSNAQDVLKSICPDFPLSDGEITTRKEFVAAVTMALNMPSATTYSSNFTDVSPKDKYATNISYAEGLGIISNVALFYPDEPVTYAQAIKIVMSAAGYDKKAQYLGGFPTGYMITANDTGVGKGININYDDAISHELATKIIFEACCIDMMETSSYGSNVEYTIIEGKNIFSTYHKIFMAEGVVKANENTGILSINDACADGHIVVDGISYKGQGYENYIGKRVRVFYHDTKQKDVVSVYETINTVTNYTGDDNVQIESGYVTAYPDDAGKVIKHKLENDYSLIYNGKCYIANDYNLLLSPNSGTVSLIDNDDDKSIDIIIVKDIEFGVIGSINALEEKIYDEYKKCGALDLSHPDVKYFVTEADGRVLKLEDLEVGNTIGYVESNDKKLYEIIRYSKKVGGTYEMNTADGNISIKNTEYPLSRYYTNNVKSLANLKLGTEVLLHLSDDGQVINITEYATSMNYAFLVDVANTTGLSSSVMVKIFNANGEMLELELAEKVKIDGISKTSKSELTSCLQAVIGKQYTYRVIKYSLNAEGEVNKIYTATDNTEGTNVIFKQPVDEDRPVIYYDSTEVSGEIPEAGTVPYILEKAQCPYYSQGAFTPYFHAGSGSKIMQIPVRPSQFNDDENFRICTTVAEAYHRVAAYDVKSGGNASFVLISNDSSAGSIGKYDGSAIIESITQGVNEDGEKVSILKLYYGGESNKYYYDSEFTKITTENAGGDGTTPQTELTINDFAPGDIIRISADSNKLLGEITMNFDCSQKKVDSKLAQSTNNSGKYVEYIQGYAISYSNSRVLLATGLTLDEINAVDGAVDISNTYSGALTRGTNLFVKIYRNRSTGTVERAEVYKEESTSNIETYFSAGSNADYVVLRQYFRTPSLNVVYVNIDG